MKCKQWVTLLLLLVPIVKVFSQNLDEEKSKKFQHYNKLLNTSTYNVESNSENLLKNAQTAYEKTYANWLLGTSMYRKGEYKNAIFYLEKAEQLGKGLDSIDLQYSYTNSLTMSYRRAGLIAQSNQAWDREQKLFKKSKSKYKEATYYYNLSKIYDIDEEYCKASEARRNYLTLIPKTIQLTDKDYLFAVYSQLAFSDAKCGNFSSAETSLSKADKMLLTPNSKKNATLSEIYDLAKSIILVSENKKDEAKQYFDSAYATSKIKETSAVTKLILKERLDANIDNSEQQLNFSKEVANITKKELSVIKNLFKYESEKQQELIKKQENKTIYWFIASLVVLIIAILGYFFTSRRNKKLQSYYQKIISDLEKASKNNTPTNFKENITNNRIDDTGNENITRELENEKEIVKKLNEIEQRNFFVSKNISAAQMAVMLKITPRNLAYILKKYRNEDFYNYLNTIRINYICTELLSNPKLIQYKIAALADLCGYSSHSQFATIFKVKTGISPSQYIQFIQKER